MDDSLVVCSRVQRLAIKWSNDRYRRVSHGLGSCGHSVLPNRRFNKSRLTFRLETCNVLSQPTFGAPNRHLVSSTFATTRKRISGGPKWDYILSSEERA